MVFLFQGNKSRNTVFKNGGFTRNYLGDQYTLMDVKKTSHGYMEPSGYRMDDLYLLDKTSGDVLLMKNEVDTIKLEKVNNHLLSGKKANRYYFLKDTLYVFDNKNFLCEKYLNTKKKTLISSNKLSGYILQPLVLPNGTVVYKSFLPKSSNIALRLTDFMGKTYSNIELFPKGITISDDGILQPYDKGFVYLCMYRNTVKLLNKKLQVQHTYKTIDTVNSSPEVVNLENGRTTYKIQPTFVNRATFIYEDNLYVYSGIFADNDKNVSSFTRFILDVYDIKGDFQYLHSLKLQLPKGVKSIPGSFVINKNTLSLFFLDGLVIKYRSIL